MQQSPHGGLAPPPTPPTPFAIFLVSFLIGILSFGGGVSAWIHSEFVVRRRWLSESDFLNDLAIARALPGTNVTNVTVITGYRLAGVVGAVAGILGLVSGPFLAVVLMLQVYHLLPGPTLDAAIEGAAAAALGATAVVAVKSIQHAGLAWYSLLIVAGLVVGAFVLRLPLIVLVAVALPLSIVLQRAYGRRGRGA